MTLDMNRDVGSIIVARSGSVWDDFQRCVQGKRSKERGWKRGEEMERD